jgi:hypothetical protein
MSLPRDGAGQVVVSRQQIARALEVRKLEHIDRALDKLEELEILRRGQVDTHYRPCALIPVQLNFSSEGGPA